VIHADSATEYLTIVADQDRPRFSDSVKLVNVDLSKCLLFGNRIAYYEFSNVRWQESITGYRIVLYDEIAKRDGKITVAFGQLKEVYQLLKQKYQGMGDNVRAGEFHCGELEMKRLQKGWPWRIMSIEFVYWALSGYGMDWQRAFIMLVALIVGFAWLYLLVSPSPFFNDFREALEFSIQVATLQRPATPIGLEKMGRWLTGLETVLGPIQVALLALAIRMRVKR
jgi:hypothetical protein